MTKPAPARPAASPAAKARTAARQLRPGALAESSVLHSLYGVVGSLILSGTLLAYVFGNERSDIMFAVEAEGRQLTPLQASAYPNMSSEALLNWCKLAIGDIFTYNFNDIVPRLNASRRFFTARGWDSFRSAFQSQSLLAQTQAQRQFVTTLPAGAAVIAEEGEVKGRYMWSVQLESITSVYTGASSVSRGAVSMRVERIQTSESSAGYPFGIVQITQ